MTQKEKLILNSMIQANPNIAILIDKLQLDTNHKTQAEINSGKAMNIINAWISEFRTIRPRTVIRESQTPQIFRTSQEIAIFIRETNFTL